MVPRWIMLRGHSLSLHKRRPMGFMLIHERSEWSAMALV